MGPLVKAFHELRPDAALIVSTGTETGQDKALHLLPAADGLIYLPLDFPATVGPVVKRIAPDLFVLLETELWPNLIHGLKAVGATVALANGRISDRSYPSYMRFRRLFRPTLESMDLFLMSSALDGERIRAMGAESCKVRVTGNTKFDAALGELPENAESWARELLDIPPGTRVLVAGSTHPGEHEIVLDAYAVLLREFPDLLLVIVPRHVDKTPLILNAMHERGMNPPYLRSSADEGERRCGRAVTIVDRTGELFRMFSLASVVFMGGSLVPRGGQNILEPAARGKVVLFGPSMEDFRDARDILLGCGAGIQVCGGSDLAEQAARPLREPDLARALGEQGRQEMLQLVGSALRNARILAECL